MCHEKLSFRIYFHSHLTYLSHLSGIHIMKCSTLSRSFASKTTEKFHRIGQLSHDIKHTWSRRSGMGLAKQLFLLRRGGGTGACGRDDADIFGGNGGFTLLLLSSSRCGVDIFQFFSLSTFSHSVVSRHHTYFSQMIMSLWVTMKLVIARVAEQILHALLAFDDGADCAAEFTLKTNFRKVSLHDIVRGGWLYSICCMLLTLCREIDDFIVGIGSNGRHWWSRTDTIVLLRLEEEREKVNFCCRNRLSLSLSFWKMIVYALRQLTTQAGIDRRNIGLDMAVFLWIFSLYSFFSFSFFTVSLVSGKVTLWVGVSERARENRKPKKKRKVEEDTFISSCPINQSSGTIRMCCWSLRNFHSPHESSCVWSAKRAIGNLLWEKRSNEKRERGKNAKMKCLFLL